MYLQITDKCNMACEHCCFKCEPGKGSHMTRKVWEAAIKLCVEYDSHICLGGGEPTLHPDFKEILIEAIAAHTGEGCPFIVTNGTNTKIALLLNRLSKAGVIEAHLSTDQFHDRTMVDEEVYAAFGYDDWDCDHGSGPIAVGRWAETQELTEKGCACESWFIQPDGNIRQCGCLSAPIIGNVFDGIDEGVESGCYKELDWMFQET